MNNDKSIDLYFFRRRELELILNQLCDIVDDLRVFLDEERRLSCKSWDSSDGTSVNDF